MDEFVLLLLVYIQKDLAAAGAAQASSLLYSASLADQFLHKCLVGVTTFQNFIKILLTTVTPSWQTQSGVLWPSVIAPCAIAKQGKWCARHFGTLAFANHLWEYQLRLFFSLLCLCFIIECKLSDIFFIWCSWGYLLVLSI